MSRKLSPDFISDLKKGKLSQVLELVQSDPTLDLNIRNNYINIYYRGGNILKVARKSPGIYAFTFDKKYHITPGAKQITTIMSYTRSNDWIQYFPFAKQTMDFYFVKHPKEERENAQLVVRENNYSKISNGTDYFIIDYEYDNRHKARFDLVAAEWPSISEKRRNPQKYKPRLVVMEMKYGDTALKGTAGMVKHVKDYLAFLSRPKDISAFKKEMALMFQQKRELGLIRFGPKGNNHLVTEFEDDIEMVFLLANHDPAKSVLDGTVREINTRFPGFEMKIIVASSLGYGLYNDNLSILKPKLDEPAKA